MGTSTLFLLSGLFLLLTYRGDSFTEYSSNPPQKTNRCILFQVSNFLPSSVLNAETLFFEGFFGRILFLSLYCMPLILCLFDFFGSLKSPIYGLSCASLNLSSKSLTSRIVRLKIRDVHELACLFTSLAFSATAERKSSAFLQNR